MADFKAKRKYELAFNTVNSFRHLTNSDAVAAHLNCMAVSAKKGAIYLIGLNLTPTTAEPTDRESWLP